MSDCVQTEIDDHALMADVRAGCESAFRKLVERHQRPLLNYFARMGAENHGDDLVQDTFLRLWNYRKKYRPAAKFTTFLYTLARHAFLDHVRKRNRFRLFADRYREEFPDSTDGGMERMRRGIDAEAALRTLTPKLRETLVLAAMQGLSYEEIAEILSVPVGTVKSRVFNALSALKETFDENRNRSAP